MTSEPGEERYVRRVILRVIPLSLAVALASLLFFAWIAEEVLEQNTKQFDTAVRNYVHQFATPERTTAMVRISWLGSQAVWVGFVCILIVLLAQKRNRMASLFAIAMTGAVILERTLKISFHRPRPQPFFDMPPPHSYAFPSGHALLSFCFWSMMAWMVSRKLKRTWLSAIVWLAAVVIIGLVGLSRIYLGVHYPSDVLAGYAAAAVWMSAVELVGGRFSS